MVRYENIGFRAVEKNDLDLLRSEHNDESTLLKLGDPFIVSELQQLQWWENISKNKNNTVYCIFLEREDNVIGVWRLQNLDATNRCVEVGIDIFKSFRGKGFSKKSFYMIFKYLFDNLNIHTIYSKVGSYNNVTLDMCEKVGFKITGRIVESLFRTGKYWDNLILCITVDDYRKMIN